MSFTHTAIGVAGVSIVASFLLDVVLPEPAPITVHSLTYSDGAIHQERTVRADGDVFHATWLAEVIEAETGEVVCSGTGSWNYPVGFKVAKIPLHEWVGDDRCFVPVMMPGEYIPRATWFWGDDQTTATGEAFVIE